MRASAKCVGRQTHVPAAAGRAVVVVIVVVCVVIVLVVACDYQGILLSNYVHFCRLISPNFCTSTLVNNNRKRWKNLKFYIEFVLI